MQLRDIFYNYIIFISSPETCKWINVILDDLSNSYEMRFFDEALSGINLAYLDFVLSQQQYASVLKRRMRVTI